MDTNIDNKIVKQDESQSSKYDTKEIFDPDHKASSSSSTTAIMTQNQVKKEEQQTSTGNEREIAVPSSVISSNNLTLNTNSGDIDDADSLESSHNNHNYNNNNNSTTVSSTSRSISSKKHRKTREELNTLEKVRNQRINAQVQALLLVLEGSGIKTKKDKYSILKATTDYIQHLKTMNQKANDQCNHLRHELILANNLNDSEKRPQQVYPPQQQVYPPGVISLCNNESDGKGLGERYGGGTSMMTSYMHTSQATQQSSQPLLYQAVPHSPAVDAEIRGGQLQHQRSRSRSRSTSASQQQPILYSHANAQQGHSPNVQYAPRVRQQQEMVSHMLNIARSPTPPPATVATPSQRDLGSNWTSMTSNMINNHPLDYQLMFKDANVAMVFTTLEGRIININERFITMSGYTEQEALMLSILDLTPKEDESKLKKIFEEVITASIINVGEQSKYFWKRCCFKYEDINCFMCMWTVSKRYQSPWYFQFVILPLEEFPNNFVPQGKKTPVQSLTADEDLHLQQRHLQQQQQQHLQQQRHLQQQQQQHHLQHQHLQQHHHHHHYQQQQQQQQHLQQQQQQHQSNYYKDI